MASTYRKLAEQVRTIYYGGIPSDDAQFSLRFIAELLAQDIAFQATKNAFENSNLGETTYASDSFTSTFLDIDVLYDSVLKQKYSLMPQIPSALPNGQEIVSITPVGIQGRRRQIVPMKNKDKFMQDMLSPVRGIILAYREADRLYYDNVQEYMFSAVNMVLIGAISTTGNLLDGTLNVPKNVEADLVDRGVARLRQLGNVPQDILNDARDKAIV